MNYKEANEKLTGRNKQSKKLANNTYLQRRDAMNAIAVKLHNTDVLTFFKDGKIVVANGGFPTVTTHDRINNYLPKGFRVSGEPVETQRSNGGMTVLRKYSVTGTYSNGSTYKTIAEVLVDNRAEISPRGKITGGDVADYREERKRANNEARRPVNRARYWQNKLEGIKIDRSQCVHTQIDRWKCASRGRRWRRNIPNVESNGLANSLQCGCRVIYREPSAKGLTVAGILAEQNQTVKAAMIRIYGTEKLFTDASPAVLDARDSYQLLEIDLGEQTPNRWNSAAEKLRALKMVCSTTGDVHIHTVPAGEVNNVPEALNWIFQVPDYLGSIGTQS